MVDNRRSRHQSTFLAVGTIFTGSFPVFQKKRDAGMCCCDYDPATVFHIANISPDLLGTFSLSLFLSPPLAVATTELFLLVFLLNSLLNNSEERKDIALKEMAGSYWPCQKTSRSPIYLPRVIALLCDGSAAPPFIQRPSSSSSSIRAGHLIFPLFTGVLFY